MQADLFDRLMQIDRLIQIKGTGTAEQLAKRLGMSRRSVYNHFNILKEMGACIKFDHFRNTYYYEQEGSLIIRFLPPPPQMSREVIHR